MGCIAKFIWLWIGLTDQRSVLGDQVMLATLLCCLESLFVRALNDGEMLTVLEVVYDKQLIA